MNSTIVTALSGMRAAERDLDGSALRIARFGPGHLGGAGRGDLAKSPARTTSPREGERSPARSVETDVVDRLRAANDFRANLSVFKTANSLLGRLLDMTT